MFGDFFFEGKQEEHHGAPNQVVQGLFTHLPPYNPPNRDHFWNCIFMLHGAENPHNLTYC
jgi:hypothetical protein